jgi:antitoxin component YwqK of YwqJK toxin-antitoxin module
MNYSFRIRFLGSVLLVFVFLSAGGFTYQKTIQRPNPDIGFQGNYLLHKNKKFTGIVEMHLEGVNIIRKTPYRNGLIQGVEREYYSNGQLAAEREYHQGAKVGVHRSWFEDGKRRSHVEYANNQYHGETWEWHHSGALATYARFEKDRCLGKKMWRADGAIYMNYVFPGGRPIGLPGAKLCYQVRDQG